jgi:D-tyrosyl-tRNA(Tyr) deacylase
MADKIIGLRAFEDTDGKMNLDVSEIGGAVLAVSQFTLLGDCRKGRRPSFTGAAPPEQANLLYEHFVALVRSAGVSIATGTFRAHMEVTLTNNGPVTLLLDSKKNF